MTEGGTGVAPKLAVGLGLLMFASLTRLAIPVSGLPAEPMTLILVVVVLATVIAGLRRTIRLEFGAVEIAMLGYLLWNVVSVVLPHEFPAVDPRTGADVVVYRFILTGTVIPFVGFILGKALLTGESRIRRMMVLLMIPAAYSGLVSILQFTGPTSLVWPRYIVDTPSYPDRAVGIFNQPVANGLVMVSGFMMAMFLIADRRAGRSSQFVLASSAVICLLGIYLTRTRSVWLALLFGVLLCAICARRARRGFIATILVAAVFVGFTWTTFASSDRQAGGVGSSSEVEDRLNIIATALWATEQEPIFGWGIGRFAQVNTEHHQQYSPDINFRRGFAYASHENDLGIAAELGVIGLALWWIILFLLLARLIRALRKLPDEGLAGRVLGLLALSMFVSWIACGFTLDLRFFDFANILTFVLVGAAVGTADGTAAARRSEPVEPRRAQRSNRADAPSPMRDPAYGRDATS